MLRVPFAALLLGLCVCACATVPPIPARDPIAVTKDPALLVEPHLKDACRRFEAGHSDRRTLLACGKWMFFYESLGTYGMPASLPLTFLRIFAAELGPGFEKLGLIADPSSPDHLPFGLAPGRPVGLTSSIAFTCASCHVARLPDGRIAIGAPNHDYRYGEHILGLTVFPSLATNGPKGHAEETVELLRPLSARLEADPKLWASLGGALMKAIGALRMPHLGVEVERMYARWPPGTQDFVIAPLAVDDEVEVVGKIPPLYGLPRPKEIAKNGMAGAMYGWSGNGKTLESFLHGFIELGGGEAKRWPETKLLPLVEYLYSLDAPANPKPAPAALVAGGKALFRDKGCLACHNGVRHAGQRVFKLDEVGTDDAVARWLDPQHTGQPCCKVSLEDPLTRGIKAPRLIALWMQKRFLHNGALSSLEQLFCLEPRPDRPSPLSGKGHMQTCDGLAAAEKRALIAYLESL